MTAKDGPLTAQQRRIINEDKYPLRIHGPGGSGKTLVLILKALTLLENASAEGRPCKLLMVLHNNDVRNNVRAAIEAIDEAGFLASTKDDHQYLDVETLHGWCMRELKVDAGGISPTASSGGSAMFIGARRRFITWRGILLRERR